MQFAKTIDLVLCGRKTQTRRKVPKDCTVATNERGEIVTVYGGGRALWRVGETYAAQRGRGKPAEGRIVLTGIRREPVATITEPDVKAEGFTCWSKDGRLYKWGLPRLHVSGEWDATEPWTDLPKDPAEAFRRVWEKMHGPGAFARDECFALTFELAAVTAS